jgi:hypothetical protein
MRETSIAYQRRWNAPQTRIWRQRSIDKHNDGDSNMLNKTKIALAAALILGSASAVMAGDSGENNLGGAVVPGSAVGVNPADHRNNPAVQAAPKSQENGIRTEGRGSSEGLREQSEQLRKDPQDPGPSDGER